MQKALELARRARDEDEVPVGAVVVHQGQAIGSGWNRREALQDPLGHAELMAIAEASRTLGSWRLLDCALYVTLEPCPMCLAACQQARVSSVVYGTPDPKGGALSLGYRIHEDARTNHRFAVEHRDEETCRTILKDFFQARHLLP